MNDVSHYAGLDFWGPVGAPRMDRLLGLLRLESGAAVLDIGCGKAEVLVDLALRYGARVTGLDSSANALALAKAAFAGRAPDADATFVEGDVAEFEPVEPFDAIVWIGGPYLGGSFAATVPALAAWLRPGGRLLLGQGFWMQPPAPAYLEATGIDAGELTDHPGTIACGTSAGLVLRYCCVSNRDEWDHFEGTIHANRERYAAEHPDAPDPQGRLDGARKWFAAQQRWGRDTMGFGFYIFAKPG